MYVHTNNILLINMNHFWIEDVILSLNCEKKSTTVLLKFYIKLQINKNRNHKNVASITT
jgi:hypothetical protein